MKVVPKICGVQDPDSGFRCGLYRPHKGAHKILTADYPYNKTIKGWTESERSFVAPRRRPREAPS